MQIAVIHVQNYRSLRDIRFSISDFACIIGENNAGKSSILQALVSFLDGKTLNSSDFFDETLPVVIMVRFDNVSDKDLELLAEDHRDRIHSILHDRSLTLVRRFPPDAKIQLRCKRLLPKEDRFREAVYDARLKGKNGAKLQEFLTEEYPELIADGLSGVTTQRKAKELIQKHVSSMTKGQMELIEADLPSGIPASVAALLPEPIYIEAVKDLSDDVKTTQQATFGKLLNVLLEAIEPKLSEVDELFQELRSRLNRSIATDGTLVDERLDDVKRIEELVAYHLRETFTNVALELKIPPPELKTILGNADFEIDDGVKGDTDSKGDGLRRAVTFAIFRSYAELSMERKSPGSDNGNRFLFLFEEPELYLHPIAQTILFDALSQISKQHQVVLTTHSPYFFQPNNTDVFIKMKKVLANPKPYAEQVQVDLSNLNTKDLFQIISFETSNTAFFARRVVLVEGDSESIAIPHIALTLHNEWDFTKNHMILLKVGGIGNIKRFQDFFEAFDVRVIVIADLDILVNNFDQLQLDEDIRRRQSSLLQAAKHVLDSQDKVGGLVGQKKAKKRLSRGDQTALWARVRHDYVQYRNDHSLISAVVDSFESFIESLKVGDRRLDIICDNRIPEVVRLKRELLAELRSKRIYVWERGSLEDYYPEGISANLTKPDMALELREQVTTREEVLSLSDEIPFGQQTKSEFEVVFSSIFGDTDSNHERD